MGAVIPASPEIISGSKILQAEEKRNMKHTALRHCVDGGEGKENAPGTPDKLIGAFVFSAPA